MSAKREQTGGWEGDAAFGADCLGGEGGQTATAGALESTADAGGTAAVVEVFPAQAEEFALAQSGAEGEFEQCAEAVALGGGEQGAGFVGGERFEAAGAGCAGADLAGDVARDLFLSDGVLQGGLEDGVDAVEGQRGESLVAARAGRAAAGLVAGGVEAAGAALAGGAELVEPCAHVFGGELGELLLPEAGDEVAVSAGGVAGVGVLAELAAGDVRQPVRQVGGDAALCGGYGTPRLLVAIFPVSLARASLRVMP